MKRNAASLFRISILFLCLAGSAWPQGSNSTVRGTVRDSSQAVIPSAKVTLVNTGTNVARETQTNEVGIYVFPGVIPGAYRITAEAAGLQKFEATLTVEVQQDTTVDAVLPLATATTSVVVQDVTTMVSTDSTELGAVLEQGRISQLPINGRDFVQLLQAIPGVDQGSTVSGNRISQSSIVQAYGYRSGTSTTLLDGAPHTEVVEGWEFLRPPGLDSIAEFHAETNASSAKFATPMSVVLSSKSGTNAIHGSMFETNRNSGYGVARRRQDYFANGKPPFLNRNEFGASIGGPIYLPKVYNGKNRTFFFFAWETERNFGASSTWYTVPTQAMRNGDFSGLVDSTGRAYNIYNPFTTDSKTWQRQPFSYGGRLNVIDPALESPMTKYLNSITPLPNYPNINPLVGQNWLGPVPTYENTDTYSARIDHRISNTDLIYGRVEFDRFNRMYSYGGQPMLNGVAGIEHQIAPGENMSLTWLHTFSPTMTNEVLVSGSRQNYHRGMGDRVTNYAAQLGLPNPFNSTDWPTVAINSPSTAWASDTGYYYQIVDYVSAQDNATKVVGKHEMQFGVQTRFEWLNFLNTGSYNGTEDFSTLATSLYDPSSTAASPLSLPYTGIDVAAMYVGAGDYSSFFTRPWMHLRRQDYAPYFQDNWRVTPRLTLNFGLRYEIRPPVTDHGGTLLGFDMTNQAYVMSMDQTALLQKNFTLPSIIQALQSYGGKIESNQQANLPASMVHTNWKELGPRLGMAYRLINGRHPLVMRSGYRITYFTPPVGSGWGYNQTNSAPTAATFNYSLTDGSQAPDGLSNYGLRSVPTCIAGVSAANCININKTTLLTPGAFPATYMLDPHYRDGKVMDWNYTLEREVMDDTLVRFAYVGNWSTNLPVLVQYNSSTPSYIWYATKQQPLPTGLYTNTATRPINQTVYGNIGYWTSMDFSKHNSFEFQLQRRYSKGLAYQVFYIVGKNLLTSGTVQSLNYYLPGSVPTDAAARARFLTYALDNNSPLQTMRWNFAADLPFGKGKKIAGNAHGIVDKVIGGWQLSGLGYWVSSRFSLPTGIYPNMSPVEQYGYKNPVQNCTSGACFPGYLWWNGYISANRINSVNANGQPNGIEGVPANYKPAGAYLIPYGSTALPANAPANTNLSSYWDTNTVWIPLTNGSVQRTTYNNNMNPWTNQWFPGPIQWFQDLSLLKNVAFTEQVRMRFNIDAFNVFNNPNNPTGSSIASNGVLATQNSGSAARVLQLTLRLMW